MKRYQTSLASQYFSFILAVSLGLLGQVFSYAPLSAEPLAVQEQPNVGRSEKAMIATVHPLASEAGVTAFDHGGNAVDAAIAAAFMLGVVDGSNSGIGGGCFMLIRTPDGKVYCLDARETAPAKATRDMYLRNGKPDTGLSQVGALAIGVPGALAGYCEAVKRFGRLNLGDLILPAAQVAESGFEIDAEYAKDLVREGKDFRKFPGSAAIFLNEQNQPHPAGTKLIQNDLGKTYRAIVTGGADWFYQGEFAQATSHWMEENGGILTATDMANYRCVWRTPLKTTYHDYTIYGFPPPSSGGVHVAQILNILEDFDLQKIHDQSVTQYTHVVSEAMKLAFADRAYWLGDPAFANVPLGLLEKSYARDLARRIDLNKAQSVTAHGMPPDADGNYFPKHTTHITAVDREGYWVAITTTVNTTFGSKVIVPGLGVIMNNQMDDFSIAPGTPNAFGLVGSEANAVEAGKRPLSSMSPTLIEKNGQPLMTVGAAGGPRIITSTLLAILRSLDLEMPLDQAISEPRFHHQWSPNKITCERSFDASVMEQLRGLGHQVEYSNDKGISQAISYDPATKVFTGVADPRTSGKALGR
ncbi:MAG: gamma-glutamyltransferase [Pirellulaceae bacterium]